MIWKTVFRGGSYDGWEADNLRVDPPPILVVWVCSTDPNCPGHADGNPNYPGIDITTAEVYKRDEVDLDTRTAVYVVGDGLEPAEVEEERELVGAGAGFYDWDGPDGDDIFR